MQNIKQNLGAAARHVSIVHQLRARNPGDQFEDLEGKRYEVIRVAAVYPGPGYLAKRLFPHEGPTECFVGFAFVKDFTLNPTIDWVAASIFATKHDEFPGKLVYCFGEIKGLSPQFLAGFSEEGKQHGAELVLTDNTVYLLFSL